MHSLIYHFNNPSLLYLLFTIEETEPQLLSKSTERNDRRQNGSGCDFRGVCVTSPSVFQLDLDILLKSSMSGAGSKIRRGREWSALLMVVLSAA